MSKKKSTRRPSFFAQPELPLPVAYPPPTPAPGSATGVSSSYDIHVSLLTDPDATVAKAELMHAHQPYTLPVAVTTGSAKRDRDDDHDPEVATLYAMSRALRKLSSRMERHADGLVRHADSNRKQKHRAKPGHAVDAGLSGVVIHLQEGETEADVPDGVRAMLSTLFPDATVSYRHDEPPQRAEYRARHAGPDDLNGAE